MLAKNLDAEPLERFDQAGMETIRPSRGARAFTLIELLVIIVTIVLALTVLLPGIARQKAKASRLQCTTNLKQIGLAFLVWALDNQNSFPGTVTTNNGGTLEYVATGEIFREFQVLSNELVTPTPKLLTCPADTRLPAKDFNSGLSNTNLSYFVGVDATVTNRQMFLSGDRNITNGVMSPNRILVLQTNSAVGWTHELHNCVGNLGLNDGSVQELNNLQLQAALKASGETNRLAIP